MQALEAENQSKHSYLAELQRVHEEERKKSRRYLHALEQDQEVGAYTVCCAMCVCDMCARSAVSDVCTVQWAVVALGNVPVGTFCPIRCECTVLTAVTDVVRMCDAVLLRRSC